MKKVGAILMTIAIVAIVLAFEIEREGMRAFRATSTTEIGRAFIIEHDVKYVAKCDGLLFANFSIEDNGVFAVNVHDSTTSFKFSTGMQRYTVYDKLKDETVKELGLVPDISFWDKRGGWILVGLLFLVGLIFAALDNRKKPSTPA